MPCHSVATIQCQVPNRQREFVMSSCKMIDRVDHLRRIWAAGHVNFELSLKGALMTLVANFVSVEHMEDILNMGMSEGTAAAIGQIDEVITTIVFS